MLDAAVSRALSPEPEHRYNSAAELRAALEAALNENQAPRSRRKMVVRSLVSAVALATVGLIAFGASKPAIREKAVAALSPVIAKAEALRARAAERMHAAHPESAPAAQVAAVALPAAATVTVVSKPDAVALELAAVEAPAAPLAQNTTPASDDGEVEDDAPATDTSAAGNTEKSETSTKVGSPSKSEPSAIGSEAIAEAVRLTAAGNKVKALNVLRTAAKKSPSDAKLLQELASMAEQNRAWGEAVRTARRLVAVDGSSDSKLELARLERKTGHRARALELVKNVLKDTPDCPEAHAMLSQLGGTERVALEK